MKEPFKLEAHKFIKRKTIPWAVCQYCGLVSLKNRFSQFAQRQGCNWKDHSSYDNERMKAFNDL